MYRILVTGTRNGWPLEHLSKVLTDHIANVDNDVPIVIVHGDAPGVDSQVEQLADKLWDVDTERHPANWKQYGKSAGPRRNGEMVDLGADVCFAFFDHKSIGTKGCAHMAANAGIPVYWFHEDGTFGFDFGTRPAI